MSLWGVKTFLGNTFQSTSIHFADGTSDNSNTNQFIIMNLIKLNTTLINVREDWIRLIDKMNKSVHLAEKILLIAAFIQFKLSWGMISVEPLIL